MGTLYNWLGVHIWLFPVDCKLEAGQKLGTLAVSNQVLTIWGQFVIGIHCLAP